MPQDDPLTRPGKDHVMLANHIAATQGSKTDVAGRPRPGDAIAPAVGTTVPGGATFREAHLIMETLHDSGRVSSLDLVELNPFLDHRGATASLLCDLAASLMGRRVLDRPTRRSA